MPIRKLVMPRQNFLPIQVASTKASKPPQRKPSKPGTVRWWKCSSVSDFRGACSSARRSEKSGWKASVSGALTRRLWIEFTRLKICRVGEGSCVLPMWIWVADGRRWIVSWRHPGPRLLSILRENRVEYRGRGQVTCRVVRRSG